MIHECQITLLHPVYLVDAGGLRRRIPFDACMDEPCDLSDGDRVWESHVDGLMPTKLKDSSSLRLSHPNVWMHPPIMSRNRDAQSKTPMRKKKAMHTKLRQSTSMDFDVDKIFARFFSCSEKCF
jgi:hypothetical protein